MDSYMILILLTDAAVMIGMTVHGWRKGFSGLLKQAVSLIVSVVTVIMLSSVVTAWQGGDTANVWFGILFLVILGIVYKLVHGILSSIRLLAHLPVLSLADTILGLILGFIEGFAILYALEYFLRLYLLR